MYIYIYKYYTYIYSYIIGIEIRDSKDFAYLVFLGRILHI